MSGKRKNLGRPDEVIREEKIETSIVRLGDLTVGRSVQQPGWHWTTPGAGEILVSEVTRALATGSGVTFGTGSPHDLKGIEGARLLYAVGDLA